MLSEIIMLRYLVLTCGLLVATHAAVDSDLVTELPGLSSQPAFKHYSGYLKATGTRMLHYWFVESGGNPSKDPVVMWTNGGPGCSSMDGLLQEHGPFLSSEDGQSLTVNAYSWNKVANMLYLENPAGVGYSYADDGNYTTSDDQTSLDNYMALQYFFANYPEFAGNDFYITGESYGGIYVPTLSVRVAADSAFNFKGFAVGNGLSDYDLNSNSLFYFAYYHGLFGEKLWAEISTYCCKGQTSTRCDFVNNQDPDCQASLGQVSDIIEQLNMYNLYAECYHGNGHSNNTLSGSLFDPMFWVFSKLPSVQTSYQKLLKGPFDKLSGVPPCIDAHGMTVYMNRKDVRTAIHIPDSLPTWEVCSSQVNYQKQYKNMKSQYQAILKSKKYRILVYNGDVDMACNYFGDEWFVDDLKQKVVKGWDAWYYNGSDGSQQVAGFAKQFENINFVTIKGAGHMVPQNKPNPALVMFKKFLSGEAF